MIVTILPSSNSFHAVSYNEKKVANGSAYLMEMKGFGILDKTGYEKPEELIEAFNAYTRNRNKNIQKPQFHIAFSCRGDEMTHEELLDFAHKYLNEMGYGQEGQPILVYAHSDTDNNHIHVITSRVDPKGRKINHSNERIRSQKVIDKLLGQDEKLKLDKTINDIKGFNYRSVSQYRSILEALGYECFEKKDQLFIKKGGLIIKSIDTSIIENISKINDSNFSEPNYNQLFGIFSKYRDLNSDLDGLKKDLRKNLGLELVFYGRKDSPYGYAVVDFKNKCVYEGSKIMSIKRLLKFQSPEERANKIDQYIYRALEDNPRITLKEINKKIKRLNAYIKKDEIIVGDKKYQLSKSLNDIFKINNKLAWIDSFKPQNKEEYDILLRFAGVNVKDITYPDSYKFNEYNNDVVNNIREIFRTNDLDKIKKELDNIDYRLVIYNGKNYIYSSSDKSLINLDRINIKLPQSKINDINSDRNINSSNSINKYGNNILNSDRTQTQSANREWEVGTKDDEEDEKKGLKY